MKKRALLFTIIIILALMIVYFILGEFGIVKMQDPSDKENIQDQNIPEEDRIPASGSSSSTTTEISESGCILEQVPFSLKNFYEYSTCNTFQEGICIDRNVICSLEVENFDLELGGNFEILFKVSKNIGGTLIEVESSTVTNFVGALEVITFEKIFNIQGEGIEGNANQAITCSYDPAEILSREIC